jgi:uncharacterized membrane protein SpoIIM required for sporulation
MILNTHKFLHKETPYWKELDAILLRIQKDSEIRLSLSEIKRLTYLYERASADLVKLRSYTNDQQTILYLESLINKTYSQIQPRPDSKNLFRNLIQAFVSGFPKTFRAYKQFFALSVAIFMVGALFGGFSIILDNDSKSILLPFDHLHGSPEDRVSKEEARINDHLEDARGKFSAQLMTHNIKVSILTLALGMTFGVGTIICLFYNGAILGAVVADYVIAGESVFLTGWLLPHGSIEIPAILIAGQAGLMIGWNLLFRNHKSLASRFAEIRSAILYLILGLSVMLVWAGLIESFFSQYHEPVLPYSVKIGFGSLELVLFSLFLIKAGKKKEAKES